MNPSRIFILRPVATSLMMLAIVLAGFMSYRMLPLSSLPEIDYPTIRVLTLYPGASPEVTVSTITSPLETQFGQMPGLNQMTSTSSSGSSVITLQFALTVSLDSAQQEVQAAINAATNFLPSDLPSPPIYSKFNPADAPVITLGITSTTLPMTQVQDMVDTRLAQKISQISGVGLVSLSGGQRPAIRVRANPTVLAAYGMDMETLRTAINTANSNMAKGSFDGPMRASTIEANDQIDSAEEFSKIIIGYKGGAPVRIADVADIEEEAENVKLAAWANTSPAIILNVYRQPGANVIEVVERIRKVLPQVKATLPSAVDVMELSDRTVTIQSAVRSVQFELILAMILVVAIIYVFLGNASATLIPGVAVPISIVGTFGAMYLLGYSLNNLTLMALTIATGFVVDDAIVMIENIVRYIEKGEKSMEAALKGSRQIGFTIISLTFSLIAVLIPLLFMGDVLGRLFHEFAITLAVSILISCFVSLTLTPMMCARYLRHESNEHDKAHTYFDKLVKAYGHALQYIFRHQGKTLAVAVGTLVLTIALYIIIPKGFFPEQDTGIIQAITEAPQDVSFASMRMRQEELLKIMLDDKDVESISAYIGVDGDNSTLNTSRMLITLKPHGKRDPVAVVMRRIQEKAADYKGLTLYLQAVQDLTIEDRVSRTRFQFTLTDTSFEALEEWTNKFTEYLRTKPELKGVANDLQASGLKAMITVDRNAASRLGITMSKIDNVLYSSFGQRLVSTIFTQSNQYRTVLEVKPEFQKGVEELNSIYITNAEGKAIPLSSFASVTIGKAPLALSRLGQFPSATISFDLVSGVSLGKATDLIRTAANEVNLPATMQLDFQGTARAFEGSLSSTVFLVIAAVITMYIVLGILYESYVHPITILSTLPSAAIGALLSLMLTGEDLGIVGVIGIILLVGIVKKNAIMMIDFALSAQREENLSATEAIYQACLLRLRPILMTTAAALLAALPLMFATGAGAELRQPLGIAMIGGLVLSQILTLFTTPVIYLYFERLRAKATHSPEESDLFSSGAP